MDYLDKLENDSIYLIREAYYQYKNTGLLWSIGKDSSTLLWLTRKAFFGEIPFPVIHIDTGHKFREMIEWRDLYADKWGLNLIVGSNSGTSGSESRLNNKIACCHKLKTETLKNVIKENGFRALLLGIRRDEHGVRAKERFFSPRDSSFKWDYKNQPIELWSFYKAKAKEDEHIRVHPILQWREVDIWRYIRRENIPVIPLYFAKNGKRYRSIGCECCCSPVNSQADNLDLIIEELESSRQSERAGRAQDKEEANAMQKLRALGYM
jgi:sulfate adenylyltransferase subunit 2